MNSFPFNIRPAPSPSPSPSSFPPRHPIPALGGKDIADPYRKFLDLISWCTLDYVQFVPFDCLYGEQFDHFDAGDQSSQSID